jgi:hypothetical protein
MQAVDLTACQHWIEKQFAERGYAILSKKLRMAPAYSPNSATCRGGLPPGAVVFCFMLVFTPVVIVFDPSRIQIQLGSFSLVIEVNHGDYSFNLV